MRFSGFKESRGLGIRVLGFWQHYGKAAGVFSFGVVLWEVMTLKEPWRCGLVDCSGPGFRVSMVQVLGFYGGEVGRQPQQSGVAEP